MEIADLTLERRLHHATLMARERVYRFGSATPLEKIALPGGGPQVWLKREDLSPVKAYKWRGAANRMAMLGPGESTRGVVTASAGNHAQGVALAAKQLGVKARIYMPMPTPRVKQAAVLHHGGEWVEIRLEGDSYDDAVQAAHADMESSGAIYIHAYDDLDVMAGQATLADEIILSGKGPFDAAFLQIGGGGMAAGVANWLRLHWPDIEIIGVEAEGQAAMKASLDAGERVQLDHVDLFCDGTAVRRIGKLPYEILRSTLNRVDVVDNAAVSRSIRTLWETHRCIAESSGALGLAAILEHPERYQGKRVLAVLCGANIDFLQLGVIAQSLDSGGLASRTLRVRIPERAGTMLRLLDEGFAGTNIADFQYGKSDHQEAWPAFTITADDPSILQTLPSRLDACGYNWEDLTGAADIRFRAIPLRGDLLSNPIFMRLDFYERPGALHDFLTTRLGGNASLCYFNYRQSGERIGRALIGIDFPSPYERNAFLLALPPHGEGYRLCEPLDESTAARLTGSIK